MTVEKFLSFEPCFANLPADFYTRMPPEGVARDPWLIHANPAGAALIGMDPQWFGHDNFPDWFSGNLALPGASPLAMVYAGHQFGQWAGQLGDGRALLLGQVRGPSGADGDWWDVQLKGGGKTPYSRMGDGRAVLRSSIREYLCGEAMHGLGIATTRSLCLVGTGMPVLREQVEPGAVLTRLAKSHIRFGHFEHFFAIERPDLVQVLADHVIANFDPDLVSVPDCYAQWLARIVEKTADLMAQWQAVGFCHGVMNSDNMSILGLTLDYGPFGFMEGFDPDHICNHSDHHGRYAYGQQPTIGLWNLHALAHALQSVIPWEESTAIMTGYSPRLTATYYRLMQQKLGAIGGPDLIPDLVRLMADQHADYSRTFRLLADSFADPQAWLDLFSDPVPAQAWLADYHAAVAESGQPVADVVKNLKAVNPKFILRNWVAELAIRAAEDHRDYSVLDRVFRVMQAPFDDHPDSDFLSAPAPEPYRDLCVSCSS